MTSFAVRSISAGDATDHEDSLGSRLTLYRLPMGVGPSNRTVWGTFNLRPFFSVDLRGKFP